MGLVPRRLILDISEASRGRLCRRLHPPLTHHDERLIFSTVVFYGRGQFWLLNLATACNSMKTESPGSLDSMRVPTEYATP